MKDQFTIESLAQFLTEHGILVRFNVIAHRIEYQGLPEEYKSERQTAQAPTIIFSLLKKDGFNRVAKQTVEDFLDVIASKNEYNPLLQLLSITDWDGRDRVQDVYNILNIADDDDLSRVLIHKFLLQCVSLCVYNNVKKPFGADGVLTLVGDQGKGKTSFARKLGINSDLFKEGLFVDPHDKDTVLKATTAFLGELGEVESTMKRDIAALKAFITNETDEIRKPYGRTTETNLRRTSYIATCNSVDFLVDTTGNRRFWTVPCEEIDLSALSELEPLQLWAQMFEEVKQKGIQSFRLTRDEVLLLAERNGEHVVMLPSQNEVLDIISAANRPDSNYVWGYGTVTDFMAEHDQLRKYSATQVGKALSACGIDSKRIRQNGEAVRARKLPFINSRLIDESVDYEQETERTIVNYDEPPF